MTIIPSSKDAYQVPKYEQNMARIHQVMEANVSDAIPILDPLLRIPD